MSAVLRIVFAAPGFFLGDTHLRVTLDGAPVFDGSFMSGFDVGGPVTTGRHVIATAIHIGGFARTRVYDVVLDAPSSYRTGAPRFLATLSYSRFWGNFSKKLDFAVLEDRC